MPKFFRKGERKLRKAQRVLNRREKGSARRLKAKRNVSLVQARRPTSGKIFSTS